MTAMAFFTFRVATAKHVSIAPPTDRIEDANVNLLKYIESRVCSNAINSSSDMSAGR